ERRDGRDVILLALGLGAGGLGARDGRGAFLQPAGDRRPRQRVAEERDGGAQWAMPHDGSACATALKPLIDSANQNECCSATARSNCACTAGLHEVGKLTLPRRSGACAPARRVEAPSQAPRITIPVPTASVRVLTMT